MTHFERRLATGVVGSWMLLSLLTAALRMSLRIAAHQSIYPFAAAVTELQWLVQAIAGAALALFIWRTRAHSRRIVRTVGVAIALFITTEVVNLNGTIVTRWYYNVTDTPLHTAIARLLIVDVTHFFILALCASAATVMTGEYLDGIAREREAAELELSIAELRRRNLQTEVRPDHIAALLVEIESLLPEEPAAAEAKLLNACDVLCAALVRALGAESS